LREKSRGDTKSTVGEQAFRQRKRCMRFSEAVFGMSVVVNHLVPTTNTLVARGVKVAAAASVAAFNTIVKTTWKEGQILLSHTASVQYSSSIA
jgi:hypothetical protein